MLIFPKPLLGAMVLLSAQIVLTMKSYLMPMRFGSSQERCYYLKLWEYHYNETRPHQGIGNLAPMQVERQNYALHAAVRMLT